MLTNHRNKNKSRLQTRKKEEAQLYLTTDQDAGGEGLTRRFHGARGCCEVICPRPCRQAARTTGIRPLKPTSTAIARSWEGSSRSSTLNPLLLRRRRPAAARRPAEHPHADGQPAVAAAGGDERSASSRTKRRREERSGAPRRGRVRKGRNGGGDPIWETGFTFSRRCSWLRRRQDLEERGGAREQRGCRE
jgi:hypothetical protein